MNQQGNPHTGIKSHAYIVWGGSEAERAEASLLLAMAAVCAGDRERPCKACAHCDKAFRHIHPDITVTDRLPDKREILVDQIRDLREDAVILPNEADRKVYILRHADSMNPAAQNAILKLLEEPPTFVSLILEADNPAALLATVRSRCAELPVGSRDATISAGDSDTVNAFYRALSDGPLALTTFTFSLDKLDRNKFIDFVDGSKSMLTARLRNSLQNGEATLSPDYLMKAIAVLDRAGEYFTANVGLGHISGMICAELIRPG